jgi:predicted lipid-binding transport protein (Tim44 family)
MLLVASMAGLPLVSEAKLGGSSRSSSTSMTSSYSASSSSSSRLGSGSSAGMSRPDVMAKARSTTPPPAGAYQGSAAAAAPAAAGIPAGAAQRSGPGWGTVAGAAAVGAAAGYMLGDRPAAPAQAPGYAPQAAPEGSQAAATRDYQRSAAEVGAPMQQNQGSGGFGFGSVLILLLLTAAGFWAFRRYQAAQSGGAGGTTGAFKRSEASLSGASGGALPAGGNDAAVEQLALKSFNEMQDANNRGDMAFLRARLDDVLFQQIEADIHARGGPGRTSVVSMRAQVLDVTEQGSRRLVSIRYTGSIVEGPDAAPEGLDEVWHFVDENRGYWKLAGIEQV